MSLQSRTIRDIGGPDDFAAVFDVSRETVDRLLRYSELLQRWQKAVNLIAPDTLSQIWHRHFADSAQLLNHVQSARNWLDLGTGGGFPGMVVAILLANQDKTRVHLVEANARKCSFLGDVARETGAPVTIHHTRIEEIDPHALGMAPDVVTARALSPLPELIDQSRPFLAAHARGLFLKGRNTQKELENAWEKFAFDARVWPSCTDRDGRIVEITGVQPKDSA